MNFASKFTYFNQRKKEPEKSKNNNILRKEQNINIDENELFNLDVNVISIGFAFLKEAQKNMGTGDAVFCSNCKAAFNSFSKMNGGASEDKKVEIKEEIEEEKKNDVLVLPKIEGLKPNERVWFCEFCENQNKFLIEEEEIPKKNDMIYIIESMNQVIEKKGDQESDISIILCIDNSGSMSITTEVKGKINLKHGLTEDEYKMLKDFIEPGAEQHQYLPSQKKNVSWVSRKQCVLGAIETQLNEMKITHPNRKVGLITFNNDVAIIGDGKGEPKFIAGDKLYKFKEIVDIAHSSYDYIMKEPLKNSSNTLIEQFSRLEENGKTSLGPALLASVALASKGKKGSMVLMCTDGLANVGLGSLDLDVEMEESKNFYEEVSKLAQENNIVISVITIKGEGCKVEILGKLTEDTNGNVTRVNPEEISKDFSGILKDEIVATNVDLEIRLHKGLRFKNEEPENLSIDGSLLKKKIGNATINTVVAFQYEVKGEDELKQMKIDIEKALEVPFQAQIHYTTPEGHKFIRVITQVQKLTKNKDLAEKNADVKILHFAAAQKSSNWARNGNYEMSRKYNKNWSNYLDSNQNMNENEDNLFQNFEMQKKQKVLRGAISKKEKRLEKQSKKKIDKSSSSDSDEDIKPKKKKSSSSDSGEERKPEKKAKKKVMSSDSDSDEDIKQMKKVSDSEEEPKLKLGKKNKKLLLSKVVEKTEEMPEKLQIKKRDIKKKKKNRELSCSSGSEKMVNSDDEGEAVMFQMKKNCFI